MSAVGFLPTAMRSIVCFELLGFKLELLGEARKKKASLDPIIATHAPRVQVACEQRVDP